MKEKNFLHTLVLGTGLPDLRSYRLGQRIPKVINIP